MKKQIIELAKGVSSNTDAVGGKGNSLLKLINADITVPNGFIISADYFIDTLKENGVYEKVKGVCECTTLDNFQENSVVLQEIIQQCNVSLETDELLQTFGNRVSVRSSAISEDGDNHSFAGLHDSFLNVEKNDVILYVKKVWASLFTDRGMGYRLRNNMPLFEGMAAIVQNMIDAKCAGVVFTQHPVEQKYILVEVASGTGDNLVSGVVTPDRYLFDRITLELISSEIMSEPLLDEQTIQSLVAQSMEIEKLYGKPQDIEWAYDEKLHFLQSRAVVTSVDIAEVMDDKVVELERDYKWAKFISRRTPTLWHSFMDKGLTRENLLKHTGEEIFVSFKKDEYELMINPDDLQRVKKLLTDVVTKDITFYDKIKNKCMKTCTEFSNFCIENSKIDFTSLSRKEITNLFQKYIETHLNTIAFRPHIVILDNIIADLISVELKRLGIDFSYDWITSTHNSQATDLPFIEMQKSALVIGAKMEQEELDFEDSKIKTLIAKHLEQYSWLGTHRYHGEPLSESDVVSTIKVKLGNCKQQLDSMNAENNRRNAELEKIKAINPTISNYLCVAQEYAYLRTYRLDVIFEGDCRLRPMFHEVGKHLGLEYDDLIYLTHDEILKSLQGEPLQGNKADLNELTKLRQEYYVSYLVNNNEIFIFEGMDNCAIEEAEVENTDNTKGTVAQKGRAKGTVKVVKSKHEIGKINKGDIIVTPMTTPDMIVGLLKCSGIITDEGGIACHAAQISREFKVPCIIGTGNATKIFKDGDTVEIIAEGLQGQAKKTN
jgi:pyruvate,water dikinase